MFDCSVCAEEFNNTDAVFSTTCGHIFHQNCLQRWMNSRRNCPQCRRENPKSHKIFLNFDRAIQKQRKNSELLSQLEREQRDRSRLERQLEQNEKLCFELQQKIEYLVAQLESIEQDNVLKVSEIAELQLQLQVLERTLLRTTIEKEELRMTLSERYSQIKSRIARQESTSKELEINDPRAQAKQLIREHKVRESLQKMLGERDNELAEIFDLKKVLGEYNSLLHNARDVTVPISVQQYLQSSKELLKAPQERDTFREDNREPIRVITKEAVDEIMAELSLRANKENTEIQVRGAIPRAANKLIIVR